MYQHIRTDCFYYIGCYCRDNFIITGTCILHNRLQNIEIGSEITGVFAMRLRQSISSVSQKKPKYNYCAFRSSLSGKTEL